MALTRIMQILSLSRLQGPAPVPSRTKDIQQAEFRAIPTVAHLTLYTLLIARLRRISRYSALEKLTSREQREELKSSPQNSDHRATINMTFLYFRRMYAEYMVHCRQQAHEF